ncbi:MAG: hypothetical protein ACTHNH_22790 [Mesorhizobium sp.]
MRNDRNSRYTIGNRKHDMFPLEAQPGLIQGITRMGGQSTINAADLQSFKHLSPGASKEFAEGGRVEVVEFGAWWCNGGFVSDLKTRIFDLESASRLTGPMAWRAVANDACPDVESNAAAESNWSAFGFLLFPAACLAMLAYISISMAASLLGVIAVLFAIAVAFSSKDYFKVRSIERMGSVQVLAPRDRLWGIAVS